MQGTDSEINEGNDGGERKREPWLWGRIGVKQLRSTGIWVVSSKKKEGRKGIMCPACAMVSEEEKGQALGW